MVADYESRNRIIKEVAAIYNWLDSQIRRHPALAGQCQACGRCCNFAAFDHKLFITTPEVIYLTASLGVDHLLQSPTLHSFSDGAMTAGVCPYQADGKCTIHPYRFSGCRIFCCTRDKGFQSRLSESALRRLKSLCTRHAIPYRYADLATGLRSFLGSTELAEVSDICQSAEESCPGGRAG